MSSLSNRDYTYFTRLMFWLSIGCLIMTVTMWGMGLWLVTTFAVLAVIYTLLFFVFAKYCETKKGD